MGLGNSGLDLLVHTYLAETKELRAWPFPLGPPFSCFPNFRRIMLHMYAMIAGLWIILKICMYEVSYIHIYYIIKYFTIVSDGVCMYVHMYIYVRR